MTSPNHPDTSLFRCETGFKVRFSDLDAMGHVNNARYVTFFEEGRAAWFRDCLGMAGDSTDYPVIVARIALDYLAPIDFGDRVRVLTRCSRIGTKSLTFEGWIMAGPEADRAAARYECTAVYYDYEHRATIPVPEGDRAKIIAFEPGPVEP